jgi:hypothetical protein
VQYLGLEIITQIERYFLSSIESFFSSKKVLILNQ